MILVVVFHEKVEQAYCPNCFQYGQGFKEVLDISSRIEHHIPASLIIFAYYAVVTLLLFFPIERLLKLRQNSRNNPVSNNNVWLYVSLYAMKYTMIEHNPPNTGGTFTRRVA